MRLLPWRADRQGWSRRRRQRYRRPQGCDRWGCCGVRGVQPARHPPGAGLRRRPPRSALTVSRVHQLRTPRRWFPSRGTPPRSGRRAQARWYPPAGCPGKAPVPRLGFRLFEARCLPLLQSGPPRPAAAGSSAAPALHPGSPDLGTTAAPAMTVWPAGSREECPSCAPASGPGCRPVGKGSSTGDRDGEGLPPAAAWRESRRRGYHLVRRCPRDREE